MIPYQKVLGLQGVKDRSNNKEEVVLVRIKKQWVLLLVIAMLAFAVVGCAQNGEEPPVDEPDPVVEEQEFEGEVLIGIMVPTTGGEATYGQDMADAIKIAADEINAAGGILGKEIKLTIGDDGCDPQMSVAAASKLVSEEVVAVVGGYCSGPTLPTLKIYGDAKIPMVVPAANSTIIAEENPGWAFQINGTGFHQAAKAVEWFEHLGAETISLVHMGDGFSADLADLTKQAWEEKGKTVATYDVINRGEQDFSALVTKIRSENPDGVYWTAYHAEGAPLIRQLRQGGYQGDIIVSDGSSSVQLLELAGQASEGVFCTAPPVVDFLPEAQGFIDEYVGRYNTQPGPYAGLSYDGMRLLADAIEKAGSFDPDAIREALDATDQFPTLAGPVSFTPEKTLVTSNFVILEAEGGKWILGE